MGLSARLDASASATGRSQAVSVTSSPPTRFTNTSCSCSDTPAWRFITANNMATRWASSPCATRRGEPKRMRSTRRLQLDQQRPATVARDRHDAARRRRARARQENRRRIAHLAQAGSPMWKNASSPTEPKRFLVARTLRKRLDASLSKYSTVSTRCSSTRGPAMAPSLVTWPTMIDADARCSWRSAPAAPCIP